MVTNALRVNHESTASRRLGKLTAAPLTSQIRVSLRAAVRRYGICSAARVIFKSRPISFT